MDAPSYSMDTDLPHADELFLLLNAGQDPFPWARPNDRVSIRQGDVDLHDFRRLFEAWGYRIETSFPSLTGGKNDIVYVWQRTR